MAELRSGVCEVEKGPEIEFLDSVGGNVPVDSEAPVVISSISRSNPLAQSTEGASRSRVCHY
jgi:hypothetical protein